MGIVDFILNLAGLLLWLNWRSNRFDPLIQRLPATLMGTLRPAAPRKLRPWHLLALVALLLWLRAAVYWWVGAETNWAGKLNLGLVVLWFSSGPHGVGFGHMALFSFASFGVTLGVFYAWLLVLSLLAGPPPIHGLVRIPLGRVDDWPRWARILLPFLVTAGVWWLASGWLMQLHILTPLPPAGRFQQALILGAGAYLLWKIPLGAILVLHLLNTYIYFGRHPFWKYIGATAQTVLQPLKRIPLRAGKLDFAPLLAVGLIFLAAHFAERGLMLLFNRLPF